MILLAVSLCWLSSCRKESVIDFERDDDIPEIGSALITEKGQPEGIAENYYVNSSGADIVAMDGAIRIKIPAGAVNAATNITIQAINNTNTAGFGKAWRITPHLEFNKPVELSLQYDELPENTIPEAVGLAYQAEDNSWKGLSGTIDTIGRTVTVSTTHFSDWSLFKAFEITPPTGIVPPGGSLELTVINNLLDELDIPVPGQEKPLSAPHSPTSALIKGWTVAGSGSISGSGAEVMYHAPSTIPNKNPVAVTAKLKGKGIKEYSLVCNIYIGKEGISFRINNGPWLESTAANDAVAANGLLVMQGGVVSGGKTMGAVSITTLDSYRLGILPWGLEYPQFNYSPGNLINYFHFTPKRNEVEVSSGGINFMKYSTTPGGILAGTFYLDKACKQEIVNNTAVYTNVRIDGFFILKRAALGIAK